MDGLAHFPITLRSIGIYGLYSSNHYKNEIHSRVLAFFDLNIRDYKTLAKQEIF